MSQFDCCKQRTPDVDDLIALINYQMKYWYEQWMIEDLEDYIFNPDIYFNNERFYDFVPIMPAMMDIYMYEDQSFFITEPNEFLKFIDYEEYQYWNDENDYYYDGDDDDFNEHNQDNQDYYYEDDFPQDFDPSGDYVGNYLWRPEFRDWRLSTNPSLN